MSGKKKAEHILAFMLIILLLLLNMTTAVSCIGINPSIPSAEKAGCSTTSPVVHIGMDYSEDAEIIKDEFLLWNLWTEHRFLKLSYAVPASATCADTVFYPNSIFIGSDEICLKLDAGVITVFLHDLDGMK